MHDRPMRANVVAFVDGRRCLDRVGLDDILRPDSCGGAWRTEDGGANWALWGRSASPPDPRAANVVSNAQHPL